MSVITISYQEKWRHKLYPHYLFDDKGRCLNSKRGKLLKRTVKNGMLGYCICGKFIQLSELRKHLEKIPQQKCPF